MEISHVFGEGGGVKHSTDLGKKIQQGSW